MRLIEKYNTLFSHGARFVRSTFSIAHKFIGHFEATTESSVIRYEHFYILKTIQLFLGTSQWQKKEHWKFPFVLAPLALSLVHTSCLATAMQFPRFIRTGRRTTHPSRRVSSFAHSLFSFSLLPLPIPLPPITFQPDVIALRHEDQSTLMTWTGGEEATDLQDSMALWQSRCNAFMKD